MYKCKYFNIKELVSKIVYDKYGEFAWSFFDYDILKDLDLIRDIWGSGIIINNWANGGSLSQCGLRSNQDQLVKSKSGLYCSAHCFCKAFDLHAGNGKNKELYNLVCDLIKNKALDKFRRVENFKSTPTWVHVDAFQTSDDKLQVFNV